MGVRRSAERVSTLAPYSAAGLQLASCVECVVTAVAKDIIGLLNGTDLTSQLTRDAVQSAMDMPHHQVDNRNDMVCKALRFLAGYGIYVEVSTDRTLGRILDAIQSHSIQQPQSMAAGYNHDAFCEGAYYSRIGRTANKIRNTIKNLKQQGISTNTWSQQAIWRDVAREIGLTHDRVTQAVHRAITDGHTDWTTEKSIFQPVDAISNPAEDWAIEAWETP